MTELPSKTVSGGTFWCRRFASWLRDGARIDLGDSVTGTPGRCEWKPSACYAREGSDHSVIELELGTVFWNQRTPKVLRHRVGPCIPSHGYAPDCVGISIPRVVDGDDIPPNSARAIEELLLAGWSRTMVDANVLRVFASAVHHLVPDAVHLIDQGLNVTFAGGEVVSRRMKRDEASFSNHANNGVHNEGDFRRVGVQWFVSLDDDQSARSTRSRHEIREGPRCTECG